MITSFEAGKPGFSASNNVYVGRKRLESDPLFYPEVTWQKTFEKIISYRQKKVKGLSFIFKKSNRFAKPKYDNYRKRFNTYLNYNKADLTLMMINKSL